MRTILLMLTLAFCGETFCQVNLVPNPSFEQYSSCPTNVAQVDRATPWIDPTNSTPDYFNSCNSSTVSVPNNIAGSQNAQDGQAYVGVGAYVATWSNFRDYVQAPLLDTMQAGKSYCVSLWISLADTSKFSVDKMGVLFSSSPVTCNPPGCVLPYSAVAMQLAQSFLNDQNSWINLSGVYTSVGAESYITIGNFFDDSNTDTAQINSNTSYNSAYYYIDNISVVEIASVFPGVSSIICEGEITSLGSDSIQGVTYSWQPSAGLSDTTTSNPVASPSVTTTYTLTQTQCGVVQTATVTVTVKTDCKTPEPFIPTILKGDQMLIVTNLETGSGLEIYDLRGRKVFVSENYQNEFGAYMVAAGTYVVQVSRPNGAIRFEKITIIR